jgi:hypothetical protein
MIFKHLFTPKWKHPKQQVRLDAIDKLDKTQDSPILKTLALEDNAVEIRRKALQKMNELSLWWQVYKQDQALKEVAEQHISSAVLNNESNLSIEIKNEYIERFAPVKTLEKLAFVETELKVRVKLLKRLANPKLIEKAFKEADPYLQLELVDLVITHHLAKSLIKHAQEDAKCALETHIENERLAVEMPTQVQNNTRVILAKLNALKDKNDYAVVKEQSSDLTSQWQVLEFKWLSEDTVSVLNDKYTAIVEKVDAHLAVLQIEHDKIQQQLAQQQQQVLALANIEALTDEIENALQLGLETPEQIQQDWLDAKVLQAKATLNETPLNNTVQAKKVVAKLDNLFNQVAKLPELVAAIGDYKNEFTQLTSIMPTSVLDEYDATMLHFNQTFKTARNHLNKIDGALQGEFKVALRDHKKQFLASMNTLTTTLDKNQNQAKRKARDVKRLIDDGRFNVAFGVFKGFDEIYTTLTPNYQQPLKSMRADLEAQLADAKDWQKYAAAPKREALLEEVTVLNTQECEDPQQRAEQVKAFRKRWNELGRLDTEQEKQQGEQFDIIIEQLFSPCRAFFAAQDVLREAAITERKTIIDQVNLLAEQTEIIEDAQWKKYESNYNRLNKQWRNAGKVDPKSYRALNEKYKVVQQQVTAKLNAYHKGNAQLKNSLVETAEQLSMSDDLATACQELKQLQQQWQTIGFAGLKAENALWQKFRQFNDDTFSKRSSEFEQQKQAQFVMDKQLIAEFTELESALEHVDQKAQLHDLATKVQEFSHQKALSIRVSALLKAITDKQAILSNKAEQASVEALFSALEQQENIPDEFISILTTSLNEKQLMTRMEILANVPSSDSTLRMAEQVAMLDDKHRGEQADINQYLKQFLAQSKGSVNLDSVKQLRTIFAA